MCREENRLNRLWYTAPAADWNQALPLGSGRLGMMVYGGTRQEILQLNEETLWSGRPHDWDNPACRQALPRIRQLLFQGRRQEAQELCRRFLVCKGKGSDSPDFGSYQTAGDLILDTQDEGSPEYIRSLDLNSGIAETVFGSVRRTHTVSHQYQVTASRLTGGRGTYRLSFRREGVSVTAAPGELRVLGSNPAQDFCTLVRVETDGSCTVREQTLCLENCSRLVIWTCSATTYSHPDPLAECRERIRAAEQAGFDAVAASEKAWIAGAMGRCRLTLPTDSSLAALPTDRRLARVQAGAQDADLLRLYFDYGRYLMICSGYGTLPANLQGVWSKDIYTPWNGDYHININLQMNYWFIDAVGLEAYGAPLYRYLSFLAENGRKTAEVMYGCRGWVAHTITNPWGFTAPGQDPAWGAFPAGAGWCCRHLYEHYAYSQDRAFLEEYWPVMRDCALFFHDYLVEDPRTGQLVPAPSSSPENNYIDPDTGEKTSICLASAMDCQIIRELFTMTLEWAGILGIRDALTEDLTKMLDRLPPIWVSPRYGTIQEWQEDYEEWEPGHRHISQLYGLYPGCQITGDHPELMDAARKTLERRLSHGGGHTGWSRAWIVNFYARLQDGEQVERHLQALLAKSTLPNLFDNHPPFQIDGNFGAPAGILEALVQSHEGFVRLLPALPPSWDHGALENVRIRGGHTLSFAWKGGKVVSGSIHSAQGGTVWFLVNGKTQTHTLEPGQTAAFAV